MVDLAISSIKVSQYKNLSSGNAFNFTPLSILIGPNASGKTNVINLLQFLHDMVSESTGEGVTRFDAAIAKIGYDHILDRRINRPNDVGICFSFPARKKNQENVLDLKLRVQDRKREVIINEESLYPQKINDKGSEPFYFYQSHNKRSGTGVVSVRKDPLSPPTHYYDVENVPTDEFTLISIPKLLENSQHSPENTPVFEVRRKLIDSISMWRFYNANNMDLEKIRKAEPKLGPSDIYLSSSGDNLPLVLFNLTQLNDGVGLDFEDKLNQAMQDALPWTRRIRAVTARLSLGIEWNIQQSGQLLEQFDLSDMSDGSVRMLCWACVLLSPQLPSLLVIEEPEIGIHPAWMRILASWIKQAATKTQVIISTHSPDLLDHFTDELESVIVMATADNEPGRFYMNRLKRESLKTQLDEGWELGDLYRVGDPTIGGWPWQ